MPTEKQNLAYITKRIKQYESSAALYRGMAREKPSQSVRYNKITEKYASSARALTHVKFYMENGEEHPDLIAVAELGMKDQIKVEINE